MRTDLKKGDLVFWGEKNTKGIFLEFDKDGNAKVEETAINHEGKQMRWIWVLPPGMLRKEPKEGKTSKNVQQKARV